MVVPIRSFSGMTRLAERLDRRERERLAMSLAQRVLDAGEVAGLERCVVTSDAVVEEWARQRSAAVVIDPGGGLDAAATAGIEAVRHGPWMVVHADLPLIDSKALAAVHAARESEPVLVPSTDGGTTVIAGSGSFAFGYGPGSFHRHLARHPAATVWTDPALMIDIDTVDDLDAITRIGHMPSLTP